MTEDSSARICCADRTRATEALTKAYTDGYLEWDDCLARTEAIEHCVTVTELSAQFEGVEQFLPALTSIAAGRESVRREAAAGRLRTAVTAPSSFDEVLAFSAAVMGGGSILAVLMGYYWGAVGVLSAVVLTMAMLWVTSLFALRSDVRHNKHLQALARQL